MGAQPAGTIARGRSLADYVKCLGDGSRCFCCGKIMKSPRQQAPGPRTLGGDVAAVCPSCGSEVSMPVEEAEEAPVPHSAAGRPFVRAA